MFLQTGLGLARNQWDNNFRAFDPYGYQLRRVADLPWMDYREGDSTISSAEVPQEVWKDWAVIPNELRKYVSGYNQQFDCYHWGVRPPDVADPILFGVREKFGLGASLPGPFKICNFLQRDKECPAPQLCPVPPPCPKPAPCPTCPTCPSCPACDCPAPVQVAPTKYGVNIGLLLAAGMTAGVGYYGYKKGWFKRKSG